MILSNPLPGSDIHRYNQSRIYGGGELAKGGLRPYRVLRTPGKEKHLSPLGQIPYIKLTTL